MTSRKDITSPIKWSRLRQKYHGGNLPQFYVFTDCERLPDPSFILPQLPRGTALILRHRDVSKLTKLAHKVTPLAQQLGLKVLIAGDLRLALKVKADGVHLSEAQAKRGPQRLSHTRQGFMISVAVHSHRAIWQAQKTNAHIVMVSPVFATKSHKNARPLGVLRALRLAKLSPKHSIALGGISVQSVKRLHHSTFFGFGAIEAWLKIKD